MITTATRLLRKAEGRRQKAEGLFFCPTNSCVLATSREQGFDTLTAVSGSYLSGVEAYLNQQQEV